VAPDHVYDAAVAWAQRFVAAPPGALAAAKAVIDGTFEKGKTATSKRVADERRRYVEVFAASQATELNS
jgi:enoyl-CoA hydratase